jgi:ABC-type lipoprotein release transport system permease subunit
LALLVGVAGAAVLTAAAGARRTGSAYPRLLEEAETGDVLVNPNDGDTDFDAIEALPQVEDAARGEGIFVVARTPDGEPDFDIDLLPLASDGRLFYEFERPVRLEGRLPRHDAADEVALSRPLADALELGVGDELPAVVITSTAAPAPVDLTVTGVGLFTRDVLQDAETRATFPLMLFGPEAARRWAEPEQSFRASVVRLRGGDEERAQFLLGAQRAAGEQLFLQTQAETTEAAQRALRPYAGALALFAVVAGVAGLLVVGQAVVRHLLLGLGDAPALVALGLTRSQLVTGTVLRAGVVGLLGAATAVVLAVTASVWMPVGPAREIEPAPGVDVDGLVLLGGGLLIVVVALAGGAVVGPLAVRRASTSAARAGIRRPSRLVQTLGRIGLAPAPVAGVRVALERGQGATSVPVRTTLAGAATGVAALVAALTFAAGLDHLLATPRLYGWSWDAVVQADSEEEEEAAPVAGSRLAALPSVGAVAPGSYGQVSVDGLAVAAIGLGEGEPQVFPPLLEGRAARAPDEVVLGSTTLRRIGRSVGDRVELEVGDQVVDASVVGRTVFPRISAYPGADKVGLGNGAALTVGGLGALVTDATTSFFLVRFADGVDHDAALAELREAFPDAPDSEEPLVDVRPQRPDDLVGYDRMAATPLVLAGLLAVLAGGTTAHALVTGVRRRRGELATLKTLGFTRLQVSSTVAWQATTVAVVALLVGLPLGVTLGRWLWVVLAERIGAIAEPVTPLVAVLVAVPAALVVANLLAAMPGRRAGRLSPAVALRAE